MHETTQLTRKEVDLLKQEEANQSQFKIIMYTKTVNVKNKLAFTIVDRKVTARKFVELYPWYFMATTVYNIIIHSNQMINSLILPIENV